MLKYSDGFIQACVGPVGELIDLKYPNLFDLVEVEVLYYLFPLLERLLVEIISFSNLINIEHQDQGSIRTINSILIMDEMYSYLPMKELTFLREMYKSEGLRNFMSHYEENGTFEVAIADINEIKRIIIILCYVYNQEYEKYSLDVIKEIPLID